MIKRRIFWGAAVFILLATAGRAQTITTTKIVNNGPDGEKLVFAVLGDGYASGDQVKYQQDVDRLVVNGLLGHDFYLDNRSAFNVYRVDLTSNQTGVSKLGAPKDTALKVVYSGDWNRCWLEDSPNTDALVTQALSSVPKFDYVLLMANESGYGGCRRGSRLYVTSGDNWDVVAHEYGHGIGNLYDEYWNAGAGAYAGSPVNVRNCSTVLDKNNVSWKQLIDPSFVIPPATLLASGMDPNLTVGMFAGCLYSSSGVYRPAYDCRMRSNKPHFCPVCLALMQKAVAPFLTSPTPVGTEVAAAPPQPYLNMVLKVTEGGTAEVLKMTEVPSPVSGRTEMSSDFAFEVRRDQQTVDVGFLPEDPFVVRGFPDPDNNRGEMFARAKTVITVVNVPEVSLNEATNDKIGLRFYKLRADDASLAGAGLANVSTAVLNDLKARNLADKKFEVTAVKLKSAAREKGLRSNQ